MTNVFLYYNFSPFVKDESQTFSGNEICFSELNSEHFLVFEKENENYHLYIAKFESKKSIGKEKPIILEMLVKNYDKGIAEHRVALRRYFE